MLPAEQNKKLQNYPSTTRQSSGRIATETAHPYRLCELEAATNKFASRIGSGGFGIVYYGKLSDGKEIAVKVPSNDSYQGKKQFSNEVALLSRIHHRNLVAFLGYCHEDGRNILVYEFMHNGTLKEQLHGNSARRSISPPSAKLIIPFIYECQYYLTDLQGATSTLVGSSGLRLPRMLRKGSSIFTLDALHRSSTETSRRATSFWTSI